MIRTLAALTACVLLSGCAGTGVTDKFGNETQPFGTDVSKPEDGLILYEANNRDELASWCNDNKGHLSTDGMNCVVVHGMVGAPWCTQASVHNHDSDKKWMNAICNGWRPAIF